jgi:hypothetical protein
MDQTRSAMIEWRGTFSQLHSNQISFGHWEGEAPTEPVLPTRMEVCERKAALRNNGLYGLVASPACGRGRRRLPPGEGMTRLGQGGALRFAARRMRDCCFAARLVTTATTGDRALDARARSRRSPARGSPTRLGIRMLLSAIEFLAVR